MKKQKNLTTYLYLFHKLGILSDEEIKRLIDHVDNSKKQEKTDI